MVVNLLSTREKVPFYQGFRENGRCCRGTRKVFLSCCFSFLKCLDLPCFGAICEVCFFRGDCEKCNENGKSGQNGAYWFRQS